MGDRPSWTRFVSGCHCQVVSKGNMHFPPSRQETPHAPKRRRPAPRRQRLHEQHEPEPDHRGQPEPLPGWGHPLHRPGHARAQEAAVATFRVWSSVQATNFPARAKVIAAGIAAQNPDVIGLQEVSIWRTGAPGRLRARRLGAPVHQRPGGEHGGLRLPRLAAGGAGGARAPLRRGQASPSPSTPSSARSTRPSGPASAIDVRYTDRDVILVRSGLTTRNADGGIYATMVAFPIPGTGDPGSSCPTGAPGTWSEVQKDGQWYRDLRDAPRGPGDPQAQPYGFIFQLGPGRRARRGAGESARRRRSTSHHPPRRPQHAGRAARWQPAPHHLQLPRRRGSRSPTTATRLLVAAARRHGLPARRRLVGGQPRASRADLGLRATTCSPARCPSGSTSS